MNYTGTYGEGSEARPVARNVEDLQREYGNHGNLWECPLCKFRNTELSSKCIGRLDNGRLCEKKKQNTNIPYPGWIEPTSSNTPEYDGSPQPESVEDVDDIEIRDDSRSEPESELEQLGHGHVPARVEELIAEDADTREVQAEGASEGQAEGAYNGDGDDGSEAEEG